jgi:hypothetical protein
VARIIEVYIWLIWTDSGWDDINAVRDTGIKNAISLSGIALFGQNTSRPLNGFNLCSSNLTHQPI